MKDDAQAEANEDLAAHVVDSVEALNAFHVEHHRRASYLQRGIDGVTRRLSRPAMVIGITAALAGWAGWAASAGDGRVDQPAFAWLELAATIAALLIALMILVTQRREAELAVLREQLTLEFALLADKKGAKIIALLEELRRDQPDVVDRIDRESEEMATPADPKRLIDAIDDEPAKSAADA